MIYNKALKEYNKEKDKTMISILPNEKKGNIKRSSVFIKQLPNKIKVIKESYTLGKRIAYYKYVNKMLVDINGNECLEAKVFDGYTGYTLNNSINLVKQIGSESKYGVIYLTNIVNKVDGFTIASKVMPNNANNINEIKLMKYVNDEILLKKKSRHFVFMYKYAICNELYFNNSRRIVCVNELAQGDLKMLMRERKLLTDNELIINLLFQTFISIGTFQNITKHYHKDCHNGNFLYQKNEEKGYYQYSFNGQKYYLKSCCYNIMIYDFGLSQEIKYDKCNANTSENIAKDYRRITNAFMSNNYGWGDYDDLPNIENDNKIMNIKLLLKHMKIINENDYFENIIKNVFIPFSPPKMLLTERPKNVINKVAFHIN
jgi:hypothetical protein